MKKKSFKKNVSWIFFGNLLHSILAFLINIIVARYLSKDDYGNINYIASWVSFFNSFAILGINNVINKYLDDDQTESNNYLCSAMFARFVASIISMVAIILLVLILEKDNTKLIFITIIYSLSFVFEIGQLLVYWFRYKGEADVVAILRIIAFIASAIVKIIAIVLFRNIYLYIVGIVLETLLFSLFLIYKYNKKYCNKFEISKNKISVILKSSYPFISAHLLIVIYAQTDKIMLKRMMGASNVASYTVAVTIAGLIATFTSAIIEGFRPEIISNFKKNKELYLKRLKQLYCIIFWICICYSTFITIFSKQVILILYGKKYFSSIPALSIIVWYTSLSYFGSVNNMYMVAESKEKYVQLTTLVGAFTNILLNLLLIPKFGISGAAIASLITQFIANYLVVFIVKPLRPLSLIILNGLSPRNLGIGSLKESLLQLRRRYK